MGEASTVYNGSDAARSGGACHVMASECLPLRKTLYLLRHGEAAHNVAEAQARASAAARAKASGHAEGSKAFEAIVKAARQAVLGHCQFLDAALSERGSEQCVCARAAFGPQTSTGEHLPMPTAVLVSPLRRTLQTAAAIFPNHPKVHVCELLRERRTGLPCDEKNLQREVPCAELTFAEKLGPQEGVADAIEDAVALRARTARLVELLRLIEDEVVCIITHKGYLRELEQGPLGRPSAVDFGTAELRVVHVRLGADGGMTSEVCIKAASPGLDLGGHQAVNDPSPSDHVPRSSIQAKQRMKTLEWIMAV